MLKKDIEMENVIRYLTCNASGLNMYTRERIQLGNHVTTKHDIIISAIFAIFKLTLYWSLYRAVCLKNCGYANCLTDDCIFYFTLQYIGHRDLFLKSNYSGNRTIYLLSEVRLDMCFFGVGRTNNALSCGYSVEDKEVRNHHHQERYYRKRDKHHQHIDLMVAIG